MQCLPGAGAGERTGTGAGAGENTGAGAGARENTGAGAGAGMEGGCPPERSAAVSSHQAKLLAGHTCEVRP